MAARPKGKTVLVVIDGSMASFYDKRGFELLRVETKTTNYSGIILEVYFVNKEISFVSDVLCWKGGNELSEQPFDFRIAWLHSNLPSIKIPQLNFYLLPYSPANYENLITIYKNDPGYQK